MIETEHTNFHILQTFDLLAYHDAASEIFYYFLKLREKKLANSLFATKI